MIKRVIAALATVALFQGVFIAFSPVVYAVDVINPACQNTTTGNVPAICSENGAIKASGKDPIFGSNGLLTTAVNILSILGSFIAVVVIIIGAAKMIVSGGDSNTIASSKRAVLYAVISLGIIGTAQIVVRFLIDRIL